MTFYVKAPIPSRSNALSSFRKHDRDERRMAGRDDNGATGYVCDGHVVFVQAFFAEPCRSGDRSRAAARLLAPRTAGGSDRPASHRAHRARRSADDAPAWAPGAGLRSHRGQRRVYRLPSGHWRGKRCLLSRAGPCGSHLPDGSGHRALALLPCLPCTGGRSASAGFSGAWSTRRDVHELSLVAGQGAGGARLGGTSRRSASRPRRGARRSHRGLCGAFGLRGLSRVSLSRR